MPIFKVRFQRPDAEQHKRASCQSLVEHDNGRQGGFGDNEVGWRQTRRKTADEMGGGWTKEGCPIFIQGPGHFGLRGWSLNHDHHVGDTCPFSILLVIRNRRVLAKTVHHTCPL